MKISNDLTSDTRRILILIILPLVTKVTSVDLQHP